LGRVRAAIGGVRDFTQADFIEHGGMARSLFD
jgi:hypothetical protein